MATTKRSKVFGFRIGGTLQEALKKYAESIGVSESDVARMALIEFLRQKGVLQ